MDQMDIDKYRAIQVPRSADEAEWLRGFTAAANALHQWDGSYHPILHPHRPYKGTN